MKGRRKGYGKYPATGSFKTGTVKTAARGIAAISASRTLVTSDFEVSGVHPDVRVRFNLLYKAHGAWHDDAESKVQQALRGAGVVWQDLVIVGRHFDIPEKCPRATCPPCTRQLELRAAGLPVPSEVRCDPA